MARYEYAVMVSKSVTDWADLLRLPKDGRHRTATTTTEVHMWMPGDIDATVSDEGWMAILNRLADDRWELHSSMVVSSVVIESDGWPNASWPVATKYILRREKP